MRRILIVGGGHGGFSAAWSLEKRLRPEEAELTLVDPGVAATLGLGRGIFLNRGIVVTGLVAWLMHRDDHVSAVPTWERRIRVLADWLSAVPAGRDIVSLVSVQHPRQAFVPTGDPDAR
jgi:NADH dehydrogenase FAD-containing subunit